MIEKTDKKYKMDRKLEDESVGDGVNYVIMEMV